MEKNGQISLSPADVALVEKGVVPQRFGVGSDWNLTLDELKAIISSGNYQLIGVETFDTDFKDADDDFKLNY